MKFSLLLFFDFAFLHFTPRPSQERGFGGVNYFCVERGAESPYWINRFDNTAKDRQLSAKSGRYKNWVTFNSPLDACAIRGCEEKPTPGFPSRGPGFLLDKIDQSDRGNTPASKVTTHPEYIYIPIKLGNTSKIKGIIYPIWVIYYWYSYIYS